MITKPVFPTITSEQLGSYESKIGAKLPDDYRLFLLSHNGGKPIRDCFNYTENSRINSSFIDSFLGLNDNSYYKLPDKLPLPDSPENLLPIAEDPGGNLICISIKGENYGKIYYMSVHQLGEESEIGDNVHVVANTFSDFLSMLYCDNISQEETQNE